MCYCLTSTKYNRLRLILWITDIFTISADYLYTDPLDNAVRILASNALP